jgi:hypothetical protein
MSPAFMLRVIPVKTGIQTFFELWTPACAGVTNLIFVPDDETNA